MRYLVIYGEFLGNYDVYLSGRQIVEDNVALIHIIAQFAGGLDKFLVFGIIVFIGMLLDGLTGYAINPSHDIDLRLVYEILSV